MKSVISSPARALRLITFLGLACLPGVALLPGCSGGGGGGSNQGQGVRSSGVLNLGNGQIGILDLRVRSNNTLVGTLTVQNGSVALASLSTSAVINLGKYGISGTYNTSTGTFACTGSINGEPFSLSVTPPSGSASGSATLNFQGETHTTTLAPGPPPKTPKPTATTTATVTGTPTATVTGTPTVTATTTATATPTTAPGNTVPYGTSTTGTLTVNLTNSAATGGNFKINGTASINVVKGVVNSTNFLAAGNAVNGTTLVQSPSFILNKPGGPLLVGDEISINSNDSSGNIVTLTVTRNLTNITTFVGTRGTLKITKVTGKKVDFTFSGITLEQQNDSSVTSTMSGSGSATLN